MKRYGIIFLCIILISLFAAEQFVIPKKKKQKITATRLKEDIGSTFGNLLTLSTELLESVAQLQKQLLAEAGKLIEQKKGTFYQSADKKQLQQYMNRLKCSYNELCSEKMNLNKAWKQIKT